MKQLLFFLKKLHKYSGPVVYFNQVGIALMSLIQGASIFLLIPFISLTGIYNLSSTRFPLNYLNGWLHKFPTNVGLLLILCVYVCLMIGQNYFQTHQQFLNLKIQQKFLRHLKIEVYKTILEADWKFFIKNKKTDLINIMLNEIIKVGIGTNFFIQFLSSVIFTIVQIGIAFFISTKMTVFILFFGSIMLLFSKSFIHKSNYLGEKSVDLSKTYLSGVTEQLNGIKEIKSNSLESNYLSWMSTMSKKIEDNFMGIVRIKNISQLIYKCVSSILITVFIYFSIILFKAQPTQLMLIFVIFSRLWPRITTIQSNLEQLGSSIPSFNAVIDLQKECKEAKEFKGSWNKDNISPIYLKQGIICHHVYFSYMEEENYALEDISMSIPANHMTAIVGRSGAGKSTLIDLLMGLNRPQKGELLVDGKPLDDQLLLSLRKSISYVPQEPFLFNTTIRENLALIVQDASDEDLWQALDFASAAEFVSKLPQGLDTVIGDRGIKLSGGERQRLVLARAILRKPSILILDEATSSLDTENESKIQQALERLKGSMTIIVIAHRLSTIRNADQVVVLDNGQIIQRGGFRQLANEASGVFSHLLNQQTELINQ